MSFLRRVAGRSLRDRVRSSVTREELGVEPLLLRIERSQLRWLGHLFGMPPGRLPREVFQACPTGRRPRGRPRTRWRNYVSRLAWERLGVPPEELEEVSGERKLSWERQKLKTQQMEQSVKLRERQQIFTALIQSARRDPARLTDTVQQRQKTTERKTDGVIKELQINKLQSGSRDFITPESHLQQLHLIAAPLRFEIYGSPQSFGMD
ncbi:hypothetical protein L3Q82_000624 [Scortum barcoo]|uniref:Uncharacterized protein n=1 Tax=Scortum barcoo TaxID=214431 RepID=A0ACB8WFM7_9TELE|nr:hypothetical protein L3Q82_000624 [Scortum barcoo]